MDDIDPVIRLDWIKKKHLSTSGLILGSHVILILKEQCLTTFHSTRFIHEIEFLFNFPLSAIRINFFNGTVKKAY